MRVSFIFFLCLVLVGCKTTGNSSETMVSGQTRDAIAVCSAGLSSGVNADVKLSVSKILEGEGGLTASAEKKIQGIFLARKDLPASDLRGIYQDYISCLDKKLNPPDPVMSLTEQDCNTYQLCERRKMSRLTTCRETVEEEASTKDAARKLYSQACMPIVRSIPSCWNLGQDNKSELDRRRSFCEAKYKVG